jgi:excisionase family DNA binding protein
VLPDPGHPPRSGPGAGFAASPPDPGAIWVAALECGDLLVEKYRMMRNRMTSHPLQDAGLAPVPSAQRFPYEREDARSKGGMRPAMSQSSNNSSIVQPPSRSHLSLEDAPDLLTFEEARQILRLGRNAMYTMLHSGEIRSVRSGRRFLIPRVALEQWLNGE